MTTQLFLSDRRALAACAAAMVLVACGGGGGAGGTGGTGSTTAGMNSTAGSTTSGAGTTSSSVSSGSGSSATPGLIDDMEDNDGAILPAEGRVGFWFTFNDGASSGEQTPSPTGFTMSLLPAPRENSKYAARTGGAGFTVWGAGMGLNLNSNGTTRSPYDASGYTGVTFWAMAAADSVTSLRVNVADEDTAPEGGVCADKCNDHFGTSIELSTSWTQYALQFSDMKQDGFGEAFPQLKASALYEISFFVTPNTTFEVYIDDIAFTK